MAIVSYDTHPASGFRSVEFSAGLGAGILCGVLVGAVLGVVLGDLAQRIW